jgi:hypothetical protein
MEGDLQTEHTKEAKKFHHPSLQTIWLNWIHVWQESILGEGQTEQGTACDSNKCEVTELAGKTYEHGQKLHMDNFLSAPELFDDLAKKQIYCCSTVRPNRTGMPQDLALNTTTVKWGDIHIRTMDDLMAILWQH